MIHQAVTKTRPYQKLREWGFKPLVVDFYAQQIWPTFSLERILAQVTEVKQVTMDTKTFVIKPNSNFKNFQAGQHILLTTRVNGERLSRTYSPTQTGRYLEITVKNITDGIVSSHLHQAIKKGSVVEISQPFGEMTWSQLREAKQFTFCAAGVGITPLRSLIQAWVKNSSLHQYKNIDLHFWAKTEQDFIFKDEFLQVARQFPNFKLKLYATRSDGAGKINESCFKDSDGVFVACGPEGFVKAAKEIAENGTKHFYGEFAESSQPVTIETETFFDLNYDGQTFKVSSNKTILESLEENGLKPASGCRMGICKSCTCMKVSGTTHSFKDKRYSTEANEEIQICVSKPTSRLTVKGY
jgi:stearoyl-CoA 9-desaturase NADPH oxidoreductase